MFSYRSGQSFGWRARARWSCGEIHAYGEPECRAAVHACWGPIGGPTKHRSSGIKLTPHESVTCTNNPTPSRPHLSPLSHSVNPIHLFISTPSIPSTMSSADEDGPPNSKAPRTRIARACENCRARRKKCQPPYPCQACRDAGLPDCLVRDKPRPLRWVLDQDVTADCRRRRSQQATSAPIEGSTYPQRTRFLNMIDEELERIYTSQTGESAFPRIPLTTQAMLSLSPSRSSPPIPTATSSRPSQICPIRFP